MCPLRDHLVNGLMANVAHENMGRMEGPRLTSTIHTKVCQIPMYMSGQMVYANIPVGRFHGRRMEKTEHESNL